MRGKIALVAWILGELITLLLFAASTYGNLGVASLFLLPPFVAAEMITGKRMWDFMGDPQLYCLTMLFGGLLYGLLVFPLVRYWSWHLRRDRRGERSAISMFPDKEADR
jgi:hypothetical protein